MLRGATHQVHVRLNRHSLLVGLTQPGYSLSSYRKLLSAYFQLYSLLEKKINQFLGKHPCELDYSGRRKLPWLSKDIAFFEDGSPAFVLDMPLAQISQEIEHVGQLIGVLYAIEGSTLGGQVISRSLAEHLGLTRSKGACFFNGYGEETLNMWNDFICFAENIASDANQRIMAEQAACQTFQLFEQVINSLSHEKRNEVLPES